MKGIGILAVAMGAAFVVAFPLGCGSDRQGFNQETEPNGTLDGGGLGDAHACVGLECAQAHCGNGIDTTVTGKVYAPNGTLPLYNAIVYVPNAELGVLSDGVACDKCGAVSGSPVVTALSTADGSFTLSHVPVGKDIPLVIQVGKWRRKVSIPEVVACTENKLSGSDLTRLPRNQKEGNMPHIALTSGNCDQLGCMLPKVGIDPSEFGTASDGRSKAVHVYHGALEFGDFVPPAWADAQSLWGDANVMKQYDMLVLSCECEEHLDNKGGGPTGAPFAAMADYLKSGGRIFTTDFMYTWYRYSADPGLKSSIAFRGDAPGAGSPMTIDTSFPKGAALADWLSNVGATPVKGEVTPDVVFGNIESMDATKSQQWATSGPLFDTPAGPRLFTVNLPVGVPADQQCGKGVHIDAHLNNDGSETVDATYPAGCASPLKPGENLLAFFFFDLASCIQDEGAPPAPPVVR